MTATTVVEDLAVPAASARPPVLPHLLRSEWAKARSVRSTYWTLAAAVTAMIGYGAINSASHAGARPGTFDPILMSLSGVLFAQLAMGVLGVLMITTEYSTGMIRSTFAVAPQRRLVIMAKAGVLGAAAFTVGTAASLIAFLSGQAIMGANGVSLTAPGKLRSVVGIGLYLGLLSILAVALGTIIRRSAGAIAALVGLILVLPALLLTLPARLQETVVRFLPGNAGQAIFTTGHDTSALSPWAGLATFALYAAAMVLALVIVRRRDA